MTEHEIFEKLKEALDYTQVKYFLSYHIYKKII